MIRREHRLENLRIVKAERSDCTLTLYFSDGSSAIIVTVSGIPLEIELYLNQEEGETS